MGASKVKNEINVYRNETGPCGRCESSVRAREARQAVRDVIIICSTVRAGGSLGSLRHECTRLLIMLAMRGAAGHTTRVYAADMLPRQRHSYGARDTADATFAGSVHRATGACTRLCWPQRAGVRYKSRNCNAAAQRSLRRGRRKSDIIRCKCRRGRGPALSREPEPEYQRARGAEAQPHCWRAGRRTQADAGV